jgi:hypothetical protein
MRRTGAVVLLASAAIVVGQSVAAASVDLEEVAAALRSNPVYVDPDAERELSEDEVSGLRSAIRDAGTPIYVAVLPDAATDLAGGDPDELLTMVRDTVGRSGTYAVVVGDSFRAASDDLAEGVAGQLATGAFTANGDDVAAVLTDFVGRVRDAAAPSEGATGSAAGAEQDDDDDDGGGAGWVLPVVLVAAAGGGGLLLWRRSQRRRQEAAERARAEEADRQMLRAELSVLADDVVGLESEVTLHPDARSDYDAAVSRYRAAQAALEYTDQPLDLVRVGRVIAEARYLMERVRAIIAGREPPSPPDDLQRPGQHGEPALTLDEDRQPAYVGYPGGFQNGWFGGTSGLFSGLLLGSLLFGGWGYGGTTIINESGDGGDDGSGGDFDGGGDFGGGDFGGGDFGGGDFGGGDFGGGDFGGGGGDF